MNAAATSRGLTAVPTTIVTGAVAACVALLAWAATGPTTPATDPTSWWGLIGPRHQSDGRLVALVLVLLIALVALVSCWCRLQQLATRGLVTARAAGAACLLWALPFALGPPLGSRDVWAYVAQGELSRRGLDPSRVPVSALGPGPLLAAVDPRWRETRPPYGGLGVLLERLGAALGGGSALGGVIALRVVAVASVAVLVVGAARLARPAERARVAVLVGCCPPLLVHLVSGAHLDAVAAALLVVALLVAGGGGRAGSPALRPSGWDLRRSSAVALLGVAATAKLFVLVAALWLTAAAAAAAWRAGAHGRRRVGRAAAVLGTDAVALVLGLVVVSVAAGTGTSWLGNLSTPGRLRTHLAPADLAALLLDPLTSVAPSAMLALTRGVAGGLAVLVVGWLVVHRPGSTGRLGLALVVVALLGPVLYPWYLAAALPVLAIGAERGRRVLLVGGTAFTAVTLPTLAPAVRLARASPGPWAAGALVLLLLAALLSVMVGRAQTSRRTRSAAAAASSTTA